MQDLLIQQGMDHASPEAIEAVQNFSATFDDPAIRKRTVEHSARVAGYVNGFAGKQVDDLVYDVAIVHDLVDRMESHPNQIIRESAKNSLSNYMETRSDYHGMYVCCLLGGLSIVEATAENYRHGPAIDLLEGASTWSSGDFEDGFIPASYWEIPSPMPDIESMADLGEEVNLETLLVHGSEMIDKLNIPPVNEMAQFKDAIEGLSFSAPFFEIVGYDGIAMAIRDPALQTRFRKLGKTAQLDQAKRLHSDARKMSVDQMFEVMIGSGKYDIDNVVEQSLLDIGDFRFTDQANRCAEGKFRIKSIGSLAAKIDRYDGEDPMDTFAATIIEDDIVASSEAFASMAIKMKLLESRGVVKLLPAHSKKKAIYAQGDEQYLQQVRKALIEAGLDPDEYLDAVPKDPDAYQVAKITFIIMHDGVETPSEVQFVTKEIRHEARLGRLAHGAAYKSGSKYVNIAALNRIYDRKSRMTNDPQSPDYLRVNGQSLERGKSLMHSIRS